MGNGIGHFAAFVTGLAAFNFDGDELGRAFAVAHDGLRQLFGYAKHSRAQSLAVRAGQCRDRRVLGLVASHHHKRVVGGCVAIHRDAVERAFRQLVGQLPHDRLRDTGISGHKTQHGRHIRANHACAFADTGDSHWCATQRNAGRKSLGHCVCGHDGFSRVSPVVSLGVGNGGGQACFNPLVGQRLHDHTC